jgi:hypothetical protein
MQITSINDVLETPGAARVWFEDGTSMVVPRSQLPQVQAENAAAPALPPQLSLGQSGATSQNMSVPPTEPNASVGPTNSQEFTTRWANEPIPQNQAQDFAPAQAPAPIASPDQQGQQQEIPAQPPLSNLDKLRGRLDSPYKIVAGSPEVSPRTAARRFTVPVSETTKVEGGHAFDPQAVEQYQKWAMEAAQKKAEADALQAQNDLQIQRGVATEAQKIYQQQWAEQKAAEDHYTSQVSALNDDAKAVANRQINPDRVFQNMSGWQTLGLAIAAGLTGFATRGQGPNQILSMMEHKVDQDIRAQEHDIANKKSGVDNALSRLSQQWGSLQAGKAALKAQQYEVIKQNLAVKAAEIGTKPAQMRSDAMIQDLASKQAQEFEQLRVASMGAVTKQTSSAYVDPRRATAGGIIPKTQAELLRDQKAKTELEGTQATTQGKQLENLEKRGELTGEIPGKASTQVTQYGEKRAEIMDTINMARQFMDRNGVTKDKDGNWVPTKGIPGIGFGTSVYPESFDTDAGQTNLQQVRQIGAMGAKAIYGILTATEKASFAEDFLPISNEKRLVKGVGSIIDKAEAKLRDLDASYGQKPVKEFEARRSAMGAEKAAKRQRISEPE